MNAVKCRLCKSDLREGSKFCTDCKTYQNAGKRFFAMFGTSLPLVVALVSLGINVFTINALLKSTFAEPRDEVVIRFIGIDSSNQTISLLVANLGNRAAAIRDAKLILDPRTAATKAAPGFDFKLPNNRLIAAGESRQLLLETSEVTLPSLAGKFDSVATCQIEVELIRFDGSLDSRIIPYDAAK